MNKGAENFFVDNKTQKEKKNPVENTTNMKEPKTNKTINYPPTHQKFLDFVIIDVLRNHFCNRNNREGNKKNSKDGTDLGWLNSSKLVGAEGKG